MTFSNIFCVGRNYARHAEELNNQIPDSPLIFSKPTHSLVQADGDTIWYPDGRGEIHHELEIVLYIGKPVPEHFTVDDVVTKMALGIDMTMRDIQSDLKQKGHPWLLAKGFKNAAVLTEFWDFPGEATCRETNFSLYKNQETVQTGNIQRLLFDFDTLLHYIHHQIGLGKGDIIYTGTPEGVGPITDGDVFLLRWGKEDKGSFVVKM